MFCREGATEVQEVFLILYDHCFPFHALPCNSYRAGKLPHATDANCGTKIRSDLVEDAPVNTEVGKRCCNYIGPKKWVRVNSLGP